MALTHVSILESSLPNLIYVLDALDTNQVPFGLTTKGEKSFFLNNWKDYLEKKSCIISVFLTDVVLKYVIYSETKLGHFLIILDAMDHLLFQELSEFAWWYLHND